MAIHPIKEELYQYASIINDLERKEVIPEDKKQSLQSLKNNFIKMVNILVKNPGKDPLDNYLFFTANRDSHTREENLLIEKQLLSELRTYIKNLQLSNLN